jgi:predicted nucleotide-binding protein
MSNNPDELTLDPRAVFVVYGRNDKARLAMFSFLRSINLKPLEWNHLIRFTGNGSPYVGDVLDVGFRVAQAAIVLFTPDDEAQLRQQYRSINEPPYEATLTPQPRPNVILEAGMALGIAPTRTILVEFGNLRPISDLHGKHFIRMNNSHARRNDLVQRLQTAGCPVDLTGNDWNTEGDFEQAVNDSIPASPQAQEAILSLNPGYSIERVKEKGTRGLEEYEIEYPLIQGLSNRYLERRLNMVLERIFKHFAGFVDEEGLPTDSTEIEDEEKRVLSWTSFEVTLTTSDLLSIRASHCIDGGGPYPNNRTSAVTIDMNSGYRYSIRDLIKTDQDYTGLLKTVIRKAFAEELKDDPYFNDEPPEVEIGKPGIYDFVFEERELVFVNLFSLHVLHGLWARILYSDLVHLADPHGPLAKLLDSRKQR